MLSSFGHDSYRDGLTEIFIESFLAKAFNNSILLIAPNWPV